MLGLMSERGVGEGPYNRYPQGTKLPYVAGLRFDQIGYNVRACRGPGTKELG